MSQISTSQVPHIDKTRFLTYLRMVMLRGLHKDITSISVSREEYVEITFKGQSNAQVYRLDNNDDLWIMMEILSKGSDKAPPLGALVDDKTHAFFLDNPVATNLYARYMSEGYEPEYLVYLYTKLPSLMYERSSSC